MEERKYIVVETNHHTDEVETYVCETLQDANDKALGRWNHLTAREQSFHCIEVGYLTRRMLADYAVDEDTGETDWTCYDEWDVCEGCASYGA